MQKQCCLFVKPHNNWKGLLHSHIIDIWLISLLWFNHLVMYTNKITNPYSSFVDNFFIVCSYTCKYVNGWYTIWWNVRRMKKHPLEFRIFYGKQPVAIKGWYVNILDAFGGQSYGHVHPITTFPRNSTASYMAVCHRYGHVVHTQWPLWLIYCPLCDITVPTSHPAWLLWTELLQR